MTSPSLKNLTEPDYGLPKKQQNELLQTLGEPHIESFNYLLEEGLTDAVKNLTDIEFEFPNTDRVRLTIEEATILKPRVPGGAVGVLDPNIYPTECRQRAETYKGKISVTVGWYLNGRKMESFIKDLGEIPVMVKSKVCHLDGLSPAELINRNEHAEEWGGYFIVKGHERLIRMLLQTRRNYPVTIQRSSWKTRGLQFSDLGILLRSVAEDQTTTNNTLHFVLDGTAKFMFSHNQCMYYVPLILMLKCFSDRTDKYIYDALVRGYEDNTYYVSCIQNMLRGLHEQNHLHTQSQCLDFVGEMFRSRADVLPSWATTTEVAEYIIKTNVLIHLDTNEDKFNALVFMTQKLFAFVQNKCKLEGVDSVMMQEILLGGHLYLQILKDKLQGLIQVMKALLLKRYRTVAKFNMNHTEIVYAASRCGTIEGQMANFISTGNIPSKSGFGLMQSNGMTIVAENINRMRYMSHFRCVHRGTFFQQMRTTEARQLLPDAWGFICPVHTPDGAPCGLLNHLTMHCKATPFISKERTKNIPKVLVNLGMIPLESPLQINEKKSYTVSLDGRILGRFQEKDVNLVVNKLRMLKIEGTEIPNILEIVLVPIKEICSQYPGLYLFTGPARMMRPVINLAANKVELIGTFEQVYLDVAVCPEEAYPGITTHMELSKISFMSNLANLIPMPDCNQSPRNMYQCQMGKQTMGTPLHNWSKQSETKLYRLQTPTSPLFRPVHHDKINLDEFGMGTNAIVAVISYTGYDMEDAMIINKSAYERGFAHGSVYKTQFVTLEENKNYFCRDPENGLLLDKLDTDGLPHPGTKLNLMDPLYCFFNVEENKYKVVKYKYEEEAIVDSVRRLGTFSTTGPRTACIVTRIPRNPSVGDKFASRAGQKGICSQKWPAEDLPWTETGLVPDIVFNPHGFPSRMTIAMMIECMAGKTASLHGLVHDATPFRFGEEDTAIDYFGRLLEAGGYNYYGTERLYSGIDGRELKADIFFGVVHYQRLRHMVSDKWQVRSTGPIDALTRQPIKGRKRGGGVRFGEMERDSLLSHGASFLLQDRLLHCSDKTTVLICHGCETLLGPLSTILLTGEKMGRVEKTCKFCESSDKVDSIEIPYIFKYLVTQLSAVNLNIKIACKEI